MTNATIVLGATWASAHRFTHHARIYGAWGAACMHAYDMLHRSMTPEQRETAEVTMIEAQYVETIAGRTVMRWSTFAHIEGKASPLRFDVLDDLPADTPHHMPRLPGDIYECCGATRSEGRHTLSCIETPVAVMKTELGLDV